MKVSWIQDIIFSSIHKPNPDVTSGEWIINQLSNIIIISPDCEQREDVCQIICPGTCDFNDPRNQLLAISCGCFKSSHSSILCKSEATIRRSDRVARKIKFTIRDRHEDRWEEAAGNSFTASDSSGPRTSAYVLSAFTNVTRTFHVAFVNYDGAYVPSGIDAKK